MSDESIPPWGFTLEEFEGHVLRKLAARGLPGPFPKDAFGRLLLPARAPLDLPALHDQWTHAPRDVRDAVFDRALGWIVDPPRIPKTWEEAAPLLLPAIDVRMTQVMQATAVAVGQTDSVIPYGDVNEHLVVALTIPFEGGKITLDTKAVESWGRTPREAFDRAARNLEARSKIRWEKADEMPGVFRGPCNDGHDGSRLVAPDAFRTPVGKGDPVVLLPTPHHVLVTGSEDEDGLFGLGRVARRTLERRGIFCGRSLRWHDGGWRAWLPPRSHSAYVNLRLLAAVSERDEYAMQELGSARIARAKGPGVRLEPLLVGMAALGGEPRTYTSWRSGRASALPKADGIVFRRGTETLGIATWEKAQGVLGTEMEEQPVYPKRWLVSAFPADWQLSQLGLEPFEPGAQAT